jgi:hypothetical protein
MSKKNSGLGPGSLIIWIYGIFAISATVRATYQLVRKFDEAPIAYSLSLVAGVVYILATFALARRKYEIARITMIVELLGVLAVGFLSIFESELFAHPSVWSDFGSGYAFVPLALPIIGLWWLRRAKH